MLLLLLRCGTLADRSLRCCIPAARELVGVRLHDIPNTFQGMTLAKVWAACPSACGKAAAMIFVAANGWHVGHASVKSVAVSPAGSLITPMAGGSSAPEPGAGIVRAGGSEEDIGGTGSGHFRIATVAALLVAGRSSPAGAGA